MIFDLLPLRNCHPMVCAALAVESVQVTSDLTTPGHSHAHRQRPFRGAQTGSKPVRLIKILRARADGAQDHQTPGAAAFPSPENEHVIPGRGTSDTANTRGQWTASSPPEPDAEIRADPVELAASWVGPGPVLGPGRTLAVTTYVEPPTGRFELELEPEIFETFMEIAATPAGPTADPGAFSPPAN